MAAELFKAMAGVNIVKVTYKGTGAAMTGLLRGEVQLMFATIAAVAPQIKTGKLRALSITSAQPSALLPGVPTVAASGLPGYESGSAYGIFAPGATPAAVVEAVHRSAAAALKSAEVRDKLIAAGVEPVGSTPREFAELIRSERARLGKVIRDAGIRDESN
jgi:tripartite-type tricarboxylate transporter receptor subunit TctC